MKEITVPETALTKYLRQTMQEHHMSVTTLARGTGVSLQTMKSYLSGQRPSLDSCRRIAIFLKVPVEKIISLVHPDVEYQRLKSMTEMYLDLPEPQRQQMETVMFYTHQQFGIHKRAGTHVQNEER